MNIRVSALENMPKPASGLAAMDVSVPPLYISDDTTKTYPCGIAMRNAAGTGYTPDDGLVFIRLVDDTSTPIDTLDDMAGDPLAASTDTELLAASGWRQIAEGAVAGAFLFKLNIVLDSGADVPQSVYLQLGHRDNGVLVTSMYATRFLSDYAAANANIVTLLNAVGLTLGNAGGADIVTRLGYLSDTLALIKAKTDTIP